jgi:hypothetical protein
LSLERDYGFRIVFWKWRRVVGMDELWNGRNLQRLRRGFFRDFWDGFFSDFSHVFHLQLINIYIEEDLSLAIKFTWCAPQIGRLHEIMMKGESRGQHLSCWDAAESRFTHDSAVRHSLCTVRHCHTSVDFCRGSSSSNCWHFFSSFIMISCSPQIWSAHQVYLVAKLNSSPIYMPISWRKK